MRPGFQCFYIQSKLSLHHSRKRPALAMTSIVKPHLNGHLNSVVKSSHKGPLSDCNHFYELLTGLFLCFKFL